MRPSQRYTAIRAVMLTLFATACETHAPNPPADPSAFTALSAGYGFTCALTAGHAAYCWGGNSYGALGDGTTTDRSTPVAVAGGLSFVAISAGSFHACGLTAAGGAYCWGDNRFSQLGDGGPSRLSPGPVAGGLSFIALSAGGENTCGVTAAGDVYCWGGADFDATPGVAATPELVVADVNFTAVSPSSLFACGLTAAGAAHCWGSNAYGQLGDGTTDQRPTPGPVAGTLTFTSLTSGWGGWNHTCGLTAAGAAHCWGINEAGQLGNGTTENGLTPVRVAGDVSFIQVEAGSGHTCAVTPTGTAFCWGENSAGQLGDGTTTNRSTPVQVAGALAFAAVSAGLGHTCAITSAPGEAYCWGADGLGGVHHTPTLVER